MRARKKPVEVEVVRFDLEKFNREARDENLPSGVLSPSYPMVQLSTFGGFKPVIATLEGDMLVSDGDLIIRGVEGEYYPCKPDIFYATYELLDIE